MTAPDEVRELVARFEEKRPDYGSDGKRDGKRCQEPFLGKMTPRISGKTVPDTFSQPEVPLGERDLPTGLSSDQP